MIRRPFFHLALTFAFAWNAACGHEVTATKPPALDPPATVHVVNHTGVVFDAWTIVIGADSGRTGVDVIQTVDSTACLSSGQVPGERLFVEAAVARFSSLDSLLFIHLIGDAARSAFADSLARGLLTPGALLASRPGLITETPEFDPAPPGYGPTDTVRWTWTATPDSLSMVVVDSTDHGCQALGLAPPVGVLKILHQTSPRPRGRR